MTGADDEHKFIAQKKPRMFYVFSGEFTLL